MIANRPHRIMTSHHHIVRPAQVRQPLSSHRGTSNTSRANWFKLVGVCLFGILYTVYLFKSSFYKRIFVCIETSADNWSNESPAAGQFSTDPVPLVCCCRGVLWSHRLDPVIRVSTEHHRINHQDAHGHVCVWNSKLEIVIKSWVVPAETTHHNV